MLHYPTKNVSVESSSSSWCSVACCIIPLLAYDLRMTNVATIWSRGILASILNFAAFLRKYFQMRQMFLQAVSAGRPALSAFLVEAHERFHGSFHRFHGSFHGYHGIFHRFHEASMETSTALKRGSFRGSNFYGIVWWKLPRKLLPRRLL